VTKAATNPTKAGTMPNSLVISPFSSLSRSRKASPKIGISTIKKENCATLSFFTPQSKPVAIVEPVQFCDGKRTVDHITVSTLDRVN
jgi:hypothetical protein